MEKWLSGRKRLPAKVVDPEQGLSGSNPDLSAILDQIINGDVLEILNSIPSDSIDCIVTSPPYYGLRDYGAKGQIGLEDTISDYVANLKAVFSQCRRVLKPRGTCWVNIGDSYAGPGYKPHKTGTNVSGWDPEKRAKNKSKKTSGNGIKNKELCGVPFRVALALQEDGWYLRSDIIWSKPNPLPESVKDRPTKAHEYIFMLTKSSKYYFDQDAVREPLVNTTLKRAFITDESQILIEDEFLDLDLSNGVETKRKPFDETMGAGGSGLIGNNGYFKADGSPLCNPNGRNIRSVWTFPTQGFKDPHFATFPLELPRRCILAGCPAGGIVLDPFIGSGTTAIVACNLGRHFIGIELNQEYIGIAEKRINAVRQQLKFNFLGCAS